MDEPTNDLDIETLELLEDLLSQFQGSLLLVSHDREFLDNVVTSTLVFEGEGKIQEYVGGYKDWLSQRKIEAHEEVEKKTQLDNNIKISTPKSAKKLSYKEEKELQTLPNLIEKLEVKQADLQKQMASAEFYKQPQEKVTAELNDLKKLESDLEQAYHRWDELEALVKQLKS
jgi:ATP-binding cassette subfamily F protein uup